MEALKYTNPDHIGAVIHKPMDHHIHNLSWTATGYGAKIPTRWMLKIITPVKYRWHTYRVYAMVYGNSSSLYVIIKGEMHLLDSFAEALIEHEAQHVANLEMSAQALARAAKALGE